MNTKKIVENLLNESTVEPFTNASWVGDYKEDMKFVHAQLKPIYDRFKDRARMDQEELDNMFNELEHRIDENLFSAYQEKNAKTSKKG